MAEVGLRGEEERETDVGGRRWVCQEGVRLVVGSQGGAEVRGKSSLSLEGTVGFGDFSIGVGGCFVCLVVDLGNGL